MFARAVPNSYTFVKIRDSRLVSLSWFRPFSIFERGEALSALYTMREAIHSASWSQSAFSISWNIGCGYYPNIRRTFTMYCAISRSVAESGRWLGQVQAVLNSVWLTGIPSQWHYYVPNSTRIETSTDKFNGYNINGGRCERKGDDLIFQVRCLSLPLRHPFASYFARSSRSII